ncbi:MAG TPA: transcriptional regulator [Bacteroidia bacterium]|nr:transcriptional regulator [Bacteroidia bacterium]
MEKYFLENDIKVICFTAKSFPDKVMEAHQFLHSRLENVNSRKFFGISHPGRSGTIIYKAAAEVLNEKETEIPGCETFIIKKGEYISKFIPRFCDDVTSIGKAFKELLTYPGIDPQGYCLEMYLSDTDVRCMVGIISEKS